jgi:hypothetical protein
VIWLAKFLLLGRLSLVLPLLLFPCCCLSDIFSYYCYSDYLPTEASPTTPTRRELQEFNATAYYSYYGL